MAPQSQAIYPLYDVTYTLHRVSPLYTGSDIPLNNHALSQHARKFRDILAGDVLRGVRVGLEPEDGSLPYMGALETVTWKLLPEEDLWTAPDETEIINDEDTAINVFTSPGHIITIAYEKIVYNAVLLRKSDEEPNDSVVGIGVDDGGFEHFPLLLTKMPNALRDTLTEFLSTTFDSRISLLELQSSYITTAFEKYLAYICAEGDGDSMITVESSRSIRDIIGVVTIFISFDLPDTTSLKQISFQISAPDLPRILDLGKKVPTRGDSPFLEALGIYVKRHMALDLKHKKVLISRIACDAFLLGIEGKVKIFLPTMTNEGESPQRRATKGLLSDLIHIAKGGPFLPE
ncbi:kinetochore complex Sim4 subunit Fta1-domain-containing protein [Tricladium varicosporioides]|nr:kinetochore complex Sim4 subunit Fta1-domain-containing protein [Hymenoscyphus varicosporioides]